MAAEARREFAAFYDATWDHTVACAVAITGDLGAAEDVAQEAYIRAWPRWSQLQHYDEPSAWVRKVALRQAVSRWRRHRVARTFLLRSRPPELVAGPDETTMDLARALAKIPEVQRRAVVMHHLAGLAVSEIADVEHCPTGTVKARLARGRAALARILGPEATPAYEGARSHRA